MSGDQYSTLPARLDDALCDRLDARTQLPFAVVAGALQLPLASYFAHLCAWDTLWTEVEELADEEVLPIWDEELNFLRLIRGDRAYLAPLVGEADSAVLAAADTLARQIRSTWRAEHVSFVGTLHALLRVLAQPIGLDLCAQRTFGLTLPGRAFWRYQTRGAELRLALLDERLLSVAPNSRVADRIEVAARSTLAAYLDIERAVEPGTSLAPLLPMRTPPGSLLPPRPNQSAAPGWGILRGSPHGRRPR